MATDADPMWMLTWSIMWQKWMTYNFFLFSLSHWHQQKSIWKKKKNFRLRKKPQSFHHWCRTHLCSKPRPSLTLDSFTTSTNQIGQKKKKTYNYKSTQFPLSFLVSWIVIFWTRRWTMTNLHLPELQAQQETTTIFYNLMAQNLI